MHLDAPTLPWPQFTETPPIVRHWLGACLRGTTPPPFPLMSTAWMSATALACHAFTIIQAPDARQEAALRVALLVTDAHQGADIVTQLPPGIAFPILEALDACCSSEQSAAWTSGQCDTARRAIDPTVKFREHNEINQGNNGGGRAPVFVNKRNDDGTSIPKGIASVGILCSPVPHPMPSFTHYNAQTCDCCSSLNHHVMHACSCASDQTFDSRRCVDCLDHPSRSAPVSCKPRK